MSRWQQIVQWFGPAHGLWPTHKAPPPRPDGSSQWLEAIVLAQVEATLGALPSWNGAKDAGAASSATYGHTYVRIVFVRTDELAVAESARLAAARRFMRQVIADYVRTALPGDGWERTQTCGDSLMRVEVRWIV